MLYLANFFCECEKMFVMETGCSLRPGANTVFSKDIESSSNRLFGIRHEGFQPWSSQHEAKRTSVEPPNLNQILNQAFDFD